MNIALIAHDERKEAIINFSIAYEHILQKHRLFATGTTGEKIEAATSLHLHKFRSGPIGGDQQIGALVATNEMDMIIFLRDPLTPQPHEPDVSALLRLCDVHYIPVATNIASAEIMIRALEQGEFSWRKWMKDEPKKDQTP